MNNYHEGGVIISNNLSFKKAFLILFVFAIFITAIAALDSVSAADNAPKGYKTHYMSGYGFNVPSSYKMVGNGWDDVNRMQYMNFKKGDNFVNVSLKRHSSVFNKNIMDGFSALELNHQRLDKKTISGISGFYNKKNKVKTFVFASKDDMIYLHVKGPKLSKVVSSIRQKDYRPYHDREYDFNDDAYYESDVYDDSFDDSFDDAAYYNYNW